MRVRLEHVSHSYARTEETGGVEVLAGVSLEIASGDFAVFMGESGSGKSTLLSLIGAIDKPVAGRVLLDEDDTSALDETALTLLRREKIGFVFQFFNLIPTLTIAENVAFPLALLRIPQSEIRARSSQALDAVGITHRARHYPNELSGGEMQRAAIARAIVHRPSLIIADEPTGNLDSQNGAAVLSLLSSIHREQRPTIVMATHSDVAAAHGDYIVRVADGRVSR
jgi:putative ABC transport system ATP-binding protein